MTQTARAHVRNDPAEALAALSVVPRLDSIRLTLRAPEERDTDRLYALFSDPAVMRYWSRAPMTDRDEAAALLAHWGNGFAAREALTWIIATPDDDAAVGTCTLFHFEPRHRRAELGYSLHPDLWGRGLAREATTLLLDWAFPALGLHRIEADIDPRNDGSRRLLLRLGFRSEGLLRERYFVGDDVSDTELFGLLASDWAAGTGADSR
jgi:ribosomal-protein-alanine N-acetyltransferase